MNEKDLFAKGCFLPDWTTETELQPISAVYKRQNKDMQTLLNELDEIKDRIQKIQAKQWHLAQLMHFHKNEFARE